jgi:hypothetical protein
MPYAPTVNDNSGQILAQGIGQGVNSLAEGIQRSIAERKKKEEERRAKEAVNAAGKGLFGEDFDVKDAKPEQYGMIINLAQQKKDEPMRALAMENEGLKHQLSLAQINQMAAAAAQQEANRRAVGQAAASPWADQSTGAIAQRALQGGADAHTADQLAQMGERIQRGQPKPERRPERVDLGGGEVGVWDGNNFSRTPAPPKASKTEADEVIALVNGLKQAEAAGDKAAAAALADALKKRTTQSSEMAQLVAGIMAGGLGLGGKQPPAAAPAKSRFTIVPEGK